MPRRSSSTAASSKDDRRDSRRLSATSLSAAAKVGALDRVGVDGKVGGQLPNAWQLLSGGQRPGEDQFAEAVPYLTVDRLGIPIIQDDQGHGIISFTV